MEELLKQILNTLEEKNQLEFLKNRLWTTEDIAFYFSLSPQTVKRGLVTRPDFPAPIKISQERGRRWLPAEIQNWAKTQKATKTQ